ncbi:Di-copper centre-containing protein [Sistotremastrum niveocremeum HHB9708]|uniref:tyrosinase n=1 Tax=Sistotremastrum niveocremeum HHB9708 TaxID=1314777 RepID=A0A164RBU0_9AGAM|nr:Di-copper centre-containing protein [Sistotremastrum niveocremeum HHB9708]
MWIAHSVIIFRVLSRVQEPKPDDEEGGPDSKNSTYAIIGIRQGWGPAPEQVPLRYEVDEWYGNPANKDQINLFFLAMSRFQSLPPDAKLSYWQVCDLSRKALAYQAWVNGVQNNQELANNLRGLQLSQGGRFTDTLGESVYRLFSEKYFSSFSAFASTAHRQSQTPTDFSSLESIHNNIHNSVGGPNGGHMSSPAVAAFDPIFWFHHCNVDRQFAIWQALNSDSWFEDPREQLADPEGNWSTPPGAIPTPENTPLAPFHTDTAGTYWTSNDAREWLKYGYSYPELQQWLPKYRTGGRFNQELYKADIAKQVNALYSDTRQILLTRGPQSSRSSRGSAGHIVSSVEGHDYVVNVAYERFALAGLSFTIHIYIGQNTCVGTLYNFSTPAHTTGVNDGCENCRRQESGHALCTGQVPITSSLLKYVADDGVPLSSMEPEQVEAYLKKNLTWKITKAYGEDVPVSSIPSLEVSLAVGTGCHYGDHSRLSKYHSYRVLPGCTEGRPGGYRRPNPPPPPPHAEAAFA